MLNWRIACLVLSFSFLLLALGCFALDEGTTPAKHLATTPDNPPVRTPADARTPADTLASCTSRCEQKFPHSVGSLADGTCTCPCEKGYVTYNQTCITPGDFENLAPVLCSKAYPVLKIYDWAYKGDGNYIYLCYKNENIGDITEDRSRRRDYWNFVGDPYSNSSVSLVTNLLTNISEREGYSKYEQVEFAIAFVQSLPYTFDKVTTPYDDYPRFPYETIHADGGDCEDTSILMAAILKKMGYDVVLLGLPGHVAVGVYCDPADFDYTVTSYPYNGRDYCYLETTGEGYKVGELPSDYSSATKVTVIPLRSPQPDLYFGWGNESEYHYAYSYDSRDTYVDVTGIRIDNFGTVPAKNVKLYVALETTQDGKVWDQYTVTVGDLAVRGYFVNGRVTNLHAPSGESFRISVVVYGDNFNSIESKTGWITWH